MWFVIDVEPFDSELAQVADQGVHQAGSDALPTEIRGDRGVEEERVAPTVPRRVHEPDESSTHERADP